MKILVLCYEHPPVGGGGGRIAAQVAAELSGRGHQVIFLTGNVNSPHRLPARETVHGVEILRVPSPRRLPDTCTVREMAYYVLWAMPAALQCVRAFRPDVIHVHFAVPTGAAGWALALLTRVPYVITAHLGDVPGGVPEQTDRLFCWIKRLTNPIWKKAAALTAVSSFVSNLAERAYGRKPVIIPNGLRLAGRSDKGRVADFAGPPRLLFVGRMSVQKNPLLALEALALVKDLEWGAIVVGDGPLRSDAEDCVVRRGMADRVRFTGWLSAEELASERRKCSILLMPSLAEGLPMAAVEALLDGLAIVGTQIPGLVDVVEPEINGIFCKAEPESFANGIRRLLENRPLLEKFRESSRRMAHRFDLEKIVDRYEEVLQQAASKKIA